MEYVYLSELIFLPCHDPITKAVNRCFLLYELTVQWPGPEGNDTVVPSSVTFCKIIQALTGAVKPGRGDGPIIVNQEVSNAVTPIVCGHLFPLNFQRRVSNNVKVHEMTRRRKRMLHIVGRQQANVTRTNYSNIKYQRQHLVPHATKAQFSTPPPLPPYHIYKNSMVLL